MTLKIDVRKVDKMKNKSIVLMAMGCITVLEIVALLNGINGVLLTGTIAVIAGLAGLVLPTPKMFKL